MWMSGPVRMESPLCRCDRPAATVHAARCPNPRRYAQDYAPGATGLRRSARRPPNSGSRQPSAEGTSRVNALSEQILSELRHLLSR